MVKLTVIKFKTKICKLTARKFNVYTNYSRLFKQLKIIFPSYQLKTVFYYYFFNLHSEL